MSTRHTNVICYINASMYNIHCIYCIQCIVYIVYSTHDTRVYLMPYHLFYLCKKTGIIDHYMGQVIKMRHFSSISLFPIIGHFTKQNNSTKNVSFINSWDDLHLLSVWFTCVCIFHYIYERLVVVVVCSRMDVIKILENFIFHMISSKNLVLRYIT